MTSGAGPTETAVSTEIVQRVATVTDQAVTQLPPLHETIDPEALDAVIDSVTQGESSLELRFAYSGCRVLVDGSGAVRVEITPDGTDRGCSD